MKLAVIINLMGMAYRMILRDLLKKAIDDPEQEWDDIVLNMLDAIFSYENV